MQFVGRALGTVALLCCGACGVSSTGATEKTGTTSEAVSGAPVAVTDQSVSLEYAAVPSSLPLPAGVAGDFNVFFVGSPLDGRVLAFSRADRSELGPLPQPPGGFILPFILHSLGPGRLAVLDAGGFPSPKPLVVANPIIYEYDYSYEGGTFQATLSRTIRFTNANIGFSEDMLPLPDGGYLLSDAVFGSIWRVDPTGAVFPGIVPKTFDPADAIPQMVFCSTMPEVQVGGVPFLFTDSTVPGVASFVLRDGTVYFNSSCAGAVFKFPFAILFDGRQPFERAADIQVVSPKPANVLVEELLEMTLNPFDPADGFIYAADALQLRLIKIDPTTGERTVVANNPTLFNFPASLGFVPRGDGPGDLLVVSNQQQLTPLLNDAITQDMTQLPYLVTEVLLKREN